MVRRAVVVAVWLLAACHESQVDKLTAIKVRVCACKTASCGEAALRDVPQQSIESTSRTQAVARDMMECLSKLYQAERPSDEPDEASGSGSGEPTGPGTSVPASARTP
jgi:hypothetical protein